jgi:sugar O-acyltransferase (sialic acid O-acetyltransferase NeuD family)
MSPSVSDSELPIYLVGCGGHGRVVLDTLLAAHRPVAGILDAGLLARKVVEGIEVLGGDEYLERLDPSACRVCMGVGVMPGNLRRGQLFDECRARGFEVATVIHPSAVIAASCGLGQGVQVLAGAVLQAGAQLEENVVVNTRASIDHDSMIGRHVMIGPGAILCGEVTVADWAYVGAGAVILPGVRIGLRAIVGAGSVVTRSVGQGEKVVGNPAKAVGRGGGK